MADERVRTVAFLSDFGTKDHYVASMKSAVLKSAPRAVLLDVSHDVTQWSVFEAAFLLYMVQRDTPDWTIHVAVVDPGVGTPRRRIVVVTDRGYFVGPDNGIFSFIYGTQYISQVVEVTAAHYFQHGLGRTFEGRDVFGPVAGQLARGIEVDKLGEPITDYLRFKIPEVKLLSDTTAKAEVCHIDRYGNLITNLDQNAIQGMMDRSGKMRGKVLVGGKEFPFIPNGVYESAQPGLFGLINSAGLLELAGYKTSAARTLEVKQRGLEIGLILES